MLSWSPVLMAGSLLGLCILAGCGSQEHAASNQANSRVSDDNVFAAPVRALEQAESVQQTLEAAAARQREALERQGQ